MNYINAGIEISRVALYNVKKEGVMYKTAKKAIIAAVSITVVVIAGLGVLIALGRMSTPPWAKAQEGFFSDVCVFSAEDVTVSKVDFDGNSRDMYKLDFTSKYTETNDVSSYGTGIADIYFICVIEQDSYSYYLESGNYAICTDDPTENNPEFVAFLKDNRWGEPLEEKERQRCPLLPDDGEKDGDKAKAALKKAETYLEVKGIEKKGELKVSICDDKGRYVVCELDGKTGGARFFKVTVGENDYGDYLAGRDPDVSAGIEETPFDPHKYECLLEELSEFFV